MDRTNAERQRRYIARLKAAAKAEATVTNGLCAACAEKDLKIAKLKRRLEEAQHQPRAAAGGVDPSMLSMSAQQRLEAAIRHHKRVLDSNFADRVHAEIVRQLRETFLPDWERRLAEADRVIKSRKGIMPRATFNIIRRCLHPDSRDTVSIERLQAAFVAFNRYERLMIAEAEAPTPPVNRPKTAADLMAMKRKGQEERRAKRNAARRA